MPLALDLRDIALDARLGNRQWRVGLAFEDLPGTAEARIQRYITQIERERHELA